MSIQDSAPETDDSYAEPLFTIGQFSTLAMLSVRMLRYYDAHGLLEPTEVDPLTGYRYYRAGLLRRATVIRSLRDIGCSVGAIAATLPHLDDADALELALTTQRQQLLLDQQRLLTQLANLERLASTLKEDYMISVDRTVMPAHYIVALRGVIANYADEGTLWHRYMEISQPLGLQPIGCGATFYDDGFKEADVDVEVWLAVEHALTVPMPLQCRQVDAQDIAVARLTGPYDQIPVAIEHLGEFLGQHGLAGSGRMFNRYLVGPMDTQDPAEYVTEVCLPIG